MKIGIRMTIPIPEVPGELELEPGTTLKDVLVRLFGGTWFAGEIIDPETGEITPEGVIDVRLNEIPYNGLSQGLDTLLGEGDRLTLSLILLGGG